jgi:hypothetical protein
VAVARRHDHGNVGIWLHEDDDFKRRSHKRASRPG